MRNSTLTLEPPTAPYPVKKYAALLRKLRQHAFKCKVYALFDPRVESIDLRFMAASKA